jgi:hypothetical protein
MNDKKLVILGIIAVLTAAAAMVVSRLGQTGQETNLVIGPLVGGLDVDAVGKIALSDEKGTQKITLVKKDNRFVVVEKDSYPASLRKVNELVNACLDIRTAELRTADKANHADLGVSEETAKTIITFYDAADKPLTGVMISENRPESRDAFARLISDDKTYLILQSPWMNSQPMNYIDTQLVQADAKKIVEVTVSDPNNVVYTLKGEKDGDVITLAAMPAGKQFKATDYRSVFTALSGLTFEDVAAKEKVEVLKFDSSYVCKLNDSTVYTLKLAKKDGKTYLDITAEFTDKTAVMKEKEVESQEQLKEKEAKLLARDAAEALAKKTANWLYILPEYKAKDLTKPFKDLIEDIPAPKADPNQPIEPNKPAA